MLRNINIMKIKLACYLLLICYRLVLLFRAVTIIPLILQADEFNDNASNCEKVIFSGGPLISFLLAALVSSYHWHSIDIVTVNRMHISKAILWASQAIFWYFIMIFFTGSVLYCSTIDFGLLFDIYLYL